MEPAVLAELVCQGLLYYFKVIFLKLEWHEDQGRDKRRVLIVLHDEIL